MTYYVTYYALSKTCAYFPYCGCPFALGCRFRRRRRGDVSQSLAGTRVRAGRAPKVHVIRGATGTTYCGLYGRPDPGGWMKPTSDEATCKTCLAAVRREQERP